MYTGFDPKLKYLEKRYFLAAGGETTLPYKAAQDCLLFKNGALLAYGVAYTVAATGVITLLSAAAANDKFQVINLGSFTSRSEAEGSLQVRISGTDGVGNVLTADLTNAYATGFQWVRDGVDIAGATNLQSYNNLLYTEDWTNAAWTNTSCTVTANFKAAPDGATTADRLQMAGGANILQTKNFDVSIGDTFTWSVFADTATPILSFGTGSIAGSTTSTVIDIGGGWWRHWLVKTSSENASAKALKCQIAGALDASVWGAQLVKGDLPLPYLKNTSVPVQGTKSQYTQVTADLASQITVRATGVVSIATQR